MLVYVHWVYFDLVVIGRDVAHVVNKIRRFRMLEDRESLKCGIG